MPRITDEIISSDDYEASKGDSREDSNVSGLSIFTRRDQVLFICALCYANFAEAACYSLQAPFFPRVAEEKGASPAVYGFIFSILEVTILFTSPIFGKLVAYISCNILMQFGLAVSGLTVILFGFTIYLPNGITFISVCFIIRIIDGIGVSANLTSSYSAMAKQFPERIALIFGLLEVAFSLGSTLGPTFGGLLYQIGGYRFPFLVLGLVLFSATFLNYYFAPKIDTPETRRPVAITTFLADFETLVDLIGICVAFTDLGLLNVILEPHVRQFNLGPIYLGLIFVTQSVSYAISSPIIGWIVDRGVSPKVMNLICCPITLIGALFVGPIPIINIEPKVWTIILSLVFIGIGEAGRALCGFVSIKKDTITRRGFFESIETYGLITSTFLSCTSVGYSIGPSVGGVLLGAYDARVTTYFMVATNIAMAILLIINLVYRYCSKSSEKDDTLSLIRNQITSNGH
ncbi:MFS-type transporter SLC18B1-like [Tetranychus urticae]|uniref:Major facilitator superfamily (MFS) profile domain-containing protein n=1 Tax=Tetranychus urticae TaxID=32264 RepID=T1KM67_TETUR|nr:MFS-type transporter SLC18B1-like [Tetranychus urticae]